MKRSRVRRELRKRKWGTLCDALSETIDTTSEFLEQKGTKIARGVGEDRCRNSRWRCGDTLECSRYDILHDKSSPSLAPPDHADCGNAEVSATTNQCSRMRNTGLQAFVSRTTAGFSVC